MANLFDAADAWLDATLKEHASESVAYSREPHDSVEVQAVRGNMPMRVAGDFGPRIDFTMQDWLILAADLTFGGETEEEPRRGDLIVAVRRGMQQTYQVMSPGGDEPEWRWSGAGGTTRRIHTKLIAEEPYA